MNIVEFNNLVRKIALACPLVNSYYNESVYECWNTKEVKYGSVVMDVTNIRTTTSTNTFTVLFYYGDRLTESKTNKNSVRTDAITVLDSIISKLYEQEGISITYNQSYTLFEQKFEDELAGAYVTVDVQVMGDGMCGFDIEVGSDFEVVQLHETIKDNGLYEWKSGKDKYYDQVVLDVDVSKGLDVDFSVIYPQGMIDNIIQQVNDDITYTKSLEYQWNPNTSASWLFKNDYKLKYAPIIDISQSTDSSQMFCGCPSLFSVPMLDTSNVVDMDGMFYNCAGLKIIQPLDTSNVINMSRMFYGCKSLETIPQFNTSNVDNMEEMFSDCYNLKSIPLLDTSKVTNMMGMFCGCKSLETVPTLDISNVTDMSYMFEYCESLVYVPQWDTSHVTSMCQMFTGCESLETVPMLDATNVEDDMSGVFYLCHNLVNFGGFKNLKKDLWLFSSNKLSHESLMNVINNLAVVNEPTKLELGSTNLSKLTDDEIAIATNKGWTVK